MQEVEQRKEQLPKVRKVVPDISPASGEAAEFAAAGVPADRMPRMRRRAEAPAPPGMRTPVSGRLGGTEMAESWCVLPCVYLAEPLRVPPYPLPYRRRAERAAVPPIVSAGMAQASLSTALL